MLLHYLGKVNSSFFCKLQQKEQKACRIWRKWNVYVVVRLTYRRIVFTAYTQSVHRSPARMHENACATRQCIVSDALVDVTPHLLYTLFQFISVVHSRQVHSLLDDAPDPVINRIKVWAVCWPKIWWNECRRCSRSRTVSRAGVLGRCLVERRKIPLIPRASRGVAVLAVVSAIDLCSPASICRQTP